MPIMDGYEATEKRRDFVKRNKFTEFMEMMNTWHSNYANIQKAWRYQIDEVLVKPAGPQSRTTKKVKIDTNLPYNIKNSINV